MRETLAVADLIPGDIIIPKGWAVVDYPWGVRTLPGTVVPLNKGGNVNIGHYYANPETQVDILRD